ncbi:hypothetical protein Taro_002373 [Colocasia esculenta]|uniref:Uncharacterized protein n=1 Tax=Colocasia esculenta TaxID=4460 RepID=A0A843TIX2_COLES|nr:hypothetical protein [Colocasia esculenta]
MVLRRTRRVRQDLVCLRCFRGRGWRVGVCPRAGLPLGPSGRERGRCCSTLDQDLLGVADQMNIFLDSLAKLSDENLQCLSTDGSWPINNCGFFGFFRTWINEGLQWISTGAVVLSTATA